MLIWIYTLLAVLIVSLVSLVGIFTVVFRIKDLKNILLFLVSLSAGTLLGGAFFHLIPEAAENGFSLGVSLNILAGIMVFFILEKIICWRHCHIPTSKSHPHPLATMNLVGDAFHNFLDGTIIAGSFLVSLPLGISTTLAVVLHEIPQEIGDFGVLLHGGYSRLKALMMNFLISLTSFLGAIGILILHHKIEMIASFLVPFTAGAFIYIAASDLIPELKLNTQAKHSLVQLLVLGTGMGLMGLLLLLGR